MMNGFAMFRSDLCNEVRLPACRHESPPVKLPTVFPLSRGYTHIVRAATRGRPIRVELVLPKGFMARDTRFHRELIHPSVFLAAGAVVVGNVVIGEESSVWFNAVLRGDTSPILIGQRCNIQDGSVLHADPGFPCTLGDGVTVGHGAIVHGATVGANVLIGMRAVVMNGATIGPNSIVGVGAVVTEGFVAPPGSLILGLPAKIRRELSDLEIAGNRIAAAHYVESSREYLSSLA